MFSEKFASQVRLLLQCLPAVRDQTEFAIKGGTAINLLLLDMPRLSVDIDLTFVPLLGREESLAAIQNGLKQIAERIERTNPGVVIKEKRSVKENYLTKLLVYRQNTMIKIEPNFVMRGSLCPVERLDLSKKVTDLFSVFVDDVPVLSAAELYAGKLCAALSRQHPRDLFDVKLLLETSGLTEELRQAFVVYLACAPRPIYELLSPNLIDIESVYKKEFLSMTDQVVSLSELLRAREQLIQLVNESLTDTERAFLLSVKNGEPDFSLMPFANLHELPGLKWKLTNVRKMPARKHAEMLGRLRKVLDC
jgi:predicted nucleotidyltransferase component of viral defense system